MNPGTSVQDFGHFGRLETDSYAGERRARMSNRRVIDLEPIAPVQALTAGPEDSQGRAKIAHRGRVIDFWV